MASTIAESTTRRAALSRRLAFAAVIAAFALPLALYAATMPPTITWWFGGSDSGDLSAAAAVLGIPHPTGYPLFVLIGHLATGVPLGEVAGRINAMNAAIAALGAALTALTILDLTRDASVRPWVRPAAAVLGALALAVSGLYWSQAIIGEVYALHAALAALIVWVWARPSVHPVLRGAAHGLSLTNHLTSVILLVAAVVAFGRRRPHGPRPAMWFLLGLATPLLLYLLLPIRAAHHPAANWGDPDTAGRFLAHVTGRQYRGLVDWRDVGAALASLPPLIRLVVGDFPLWAAPAAAAGVAALARGRRPFLEFSALAAGGALLFTAVYRVPDRAPYLLPAYVIGGVWAGVGLVAAASALASWAPARTRPRLLRAGGALAVVLLLAVQAARTEMRVNLHGDDSALIFARATLGRLPQGATYYTARDDVTFALWYAQRALGIRPDVRVVDVRNPALSAQPGGETR